MPNTIADNLQALDTARLNIADAIINKGGTVNTDKRFSLFPDDINTIPTANLTTLDVTENGTYYESTPTEITSTSFPITLNNSLGTNLLDYLISSNMSQTGTPTPDNPIQPQETGERTGNLYPLDESKLHVGRIENDGTIDYEIGTLTVGTNSVTYEANEAWRGFYTDFIQVNEKEKLTFSLTNSATVALSCSCYDENDNFLGKATAPSTTSTKTFTLLTGTKKVRVSVTSSDKTYTILRPMLNTGSTALPYEPYGYKIPISSASTTTPVYLGEVETTRRIRKLVLTGNEGWQRTSNGAYYLPSSKCPLDYLRAYNVIICTCTHYQAQATVTGSTFVNNNCITFYANVTPQTYEMYIAARDIATLDEFQAYLQQQYSAGTPVTVWYVLATPTTGIVNEPLRKIGDYADTLSYEQAGVQIPTNRGNTVIDVLTELKPSEMYIKYDQPSEYAGYNIVNVNVPIPTKYVTEITITENIIEDNIFKNYTALETAILPNTLTTIGIGSFENCTSLTLTTLPDTVTTINDNAFNNCTSLSLTTLPTSLITIGNNAFSGTAMAGEIHIPNTVTTIGDNIFSNTGITDIIFDGTPTTISSNAFSNINSLETIYVPWAEGTVTGAPWGAESNVTILYVNTNWHDIREVVRKGKAQQFYPLGTVLYDDFDSTNTNRTAYEVVAYNHFNDSSLSAQGYVDSMTLCEKYVRYGVVVDDAEALMAVTTELPAGTYKFTIPNYDATYGGNKTYYFVLNNSVPVGGQLVLNWPYQAVPRTITTYASATATTSIESYGTAASPLPEWVDGTSPEAIDLGTVTMSATATTNTYGIFNHIHRARYGSNNYAQSDIRQYMNATTTNWWTPQTIFDRIHSLNSSTGILGTLNTDFVNVLATPSITNIANNTFEYQSLNGDTFTLNTEYTIDTDKLFLLSHSEVNLSTSPTLGTVLDYYVYADNTKRIKYDRTNNSTARYWWFRTPHPTYAYNVRSCSTSGALGGNTAYDGRGCVPACIIQ